MARQGIAGLNILLGIKFRVNGALFDPFNVGTVKIYNAAVGGTLLDEIIPYQVSTGYYQAQFGIPSDLAAGNYYDEWTWVGEEFMATNTQRYTFEVVASGPVDEPEPATASGCYRSRPHWPGPTGLQVVQDVGNGMGVSLWWQQAIPGDPDKQVHYNIYHATTRLGVFETRFPKAVTTGQQAIINVTPGNQHYFAIRATEFDPREFNIQHLTQVGDGVGAYPEPTTLLEEIDAYGATIKVENNGDFPNKGFLLIGTEVIKYSSAGTNEFYVEDTQRGTYSTAINPHLVGEEVRLFTGIEEKNSLIRGYTAAWHESNGTPRNLEAIGQVNVDEDGYRARTEDVVTTDLKSSDSENIDFPSYDYQGYHRPSIQDTFSGKCVGSYVGGDFGGQRGFNFVDQSLSRLDAMLQVTGEPVLLLRRKQTGQRCRCMTLRRENQRFRCAHCFATGFDRGYDRFFNNRAISESFVNTDGLILVRVSPYADDLKLEQGQGLTQPMEVTAWTINYPGLKDRDVLVRYNMDGTEEFRYEILDVTRNKLIFNQYGKQEFRMRRLDKTDVIYQYTTNNPEFYVFQ